MLDLTEQTGSSPGPQKSQPLLATLVNNLPGMAYRGCHDARRTMLFVSQGSVELTGYQPDDLLGNQAIAYGELIHPDDRTAVFQEIESAIAGQRPYRCTYRITTADGQEKWALEKGQAIYTPQGVAEALEGFITDHTERVLALQLLEQRVADRTRRLSALYDILYVASDPSDLHTTIARSLARVMNAIQAQVGIIHLLTESGNALRLVAQQGLSETAATRIDQIPVEDSQLAGWVVAHRQPLIIPKMSEDPRAANLSYSSTFDVYIGVPIVGNDEVRGVFSILSEDLSRTAAREEMALLVSVGEQLGVVVENARLRQKAEQLVLLEERNRLARELHDSVTQSLYSVTLFAEAGRNLIQSGEHERASRLFEDVLETVQQALKEMRLLVHRLRPSLLETEGLARALQHRLRAVEGRAGVKNQLIVKGKLDMNTEVEEALYYVAQEALNNAIKHAVASEVRLFLQQDGQGIIALSVTDNGTGFDPETAAEGGGLGLTSMRERIEKLGGAVTVQSVVGQGTTVRAHLPAVARTSQ